MVLKILAGLFALIVLADFSLGFQNYIAPEAGRALSRMTENAASGGLKLLSYEGGSDGFGTSLSGIVENQGSDIISGAEIEFSITDSAGNVIGTARGYLTAPLAPGQHWAFDAYCPHAAPGGHSRLLSLYPR